MIYSQYGNPVEIISEIKTDGTIWIKRISDGIEFHVPVLSLRAGKGIEEIVAEANKYAEASESLNDGEDLS